MADHSLAWDDAEVEKAEDRWNEELEYRENCINQLLSIYADCRQFMNLSDILRLLLNAK